MIDREDIILEKQGLKEGHFLFFNLLFYPKDLFLFKVE